jgi:hypothetical protein
MQMAGKETDPSPEKPVQSARTPTERKRKRKTNPAGNAPVDPASAAQLAAIDPGGKGVKKINEYFSKHNPSSPVRPVPSGIDVIKLFMAVID